MMHKVVGGREGGKSREKGWMGRNGSDKETKGENECPV